MRDVSFPGKEPRGSSPETQWVLSKYHPSPLQWRGCKYSDTNRITVWQTFSLLRLIRNNPTVWFSSENTWISGKHVSFMKTAYRPFEIGEVPGKFICLIVAPIPEGSDNRYSITKGLNLSWRSIETHPYLMDSCPAILVLCIAICIYPKLLKISISGRKKKDTSFCVTGDLPFYSLWPSLW